MSAQEGVCPWGRGVSVHRWVSAQQGCLPTGVSALRGVCPEGCLPSGDVFPQRGVCRGGGSADGNYITSLLEI